MEYVYILPSDQAWGTPSAHRHLAPLLEHTRATLPHMLVWPFSADTLHTPVEPWQCTHMPHTTEP